MTLTITEAALALGSWVELSILGKATILLALGLIAARLAARTRASIRHLLLSTIFATLLGLPLVIFTAPAVTIEVPVYRTSDSTGASRMAPRSDVFISPTSGVSGRLASGSDHWSGPSWLTLIRAGWIAGAILLLVSLAVDLWRLRRIRRQGLPWPERRNFVQSLVAESGVRRSVEVLLHEEISAPLTCGVWRAAVLLPSDAREWSEADLRRAFLHELEHVRRCDWGIQLAARVICAFYWFHPLVWVAWRSLCLEAERACDDAVVRSAGHIEYAEQLLLLARRLSKPHPQATLGMAKRSDLSIRVSALLDGSQRRGRAGSLAAAGVVGIASLAVLSIAPVRAVTHFKDTPSTATQESSSQANGTRQLRPGRVDRALDRALYEAAEGGDVSGIDELLNAGANVNCALRGDGSPLIGAARKGQIAAVRLLLERGADPNMPVPGDGNPLIMAAREGHADVVAFLLDKGAEIDRMVPGDENALIQASGNGRLEVVKLLIGRGADVNARVWVERSSAGASGEWRSPLNMARKGGHQSVVAFLLEAGARE
jgi:beta-lactamase regulating signal transducer with metallopeptidase domain